MKTLKQNRSLHFEIWLIREKECVQMLFVFAESNQASVLEILHEINKNYTL